MLGGVNLIYALVAPLRSQLPSSLGTFLPSHGILIGRPNRSSSSWWVSTVQAKRQPQRNLPTSCRRKVTRLYWLPVIHFVQPLVHNSKPGQKN
jgi:hypothetical protein